MTRIAIVDNEEEFLTSLSGYIQRYSEETHQQFLARTFKDIETFLDAFNKDVFDLIFLDINFPEERSGLDVASEISKKN